MEYKTLTGTPKHIFFVEDDLSLINGLSFAMKKQGYEIWVALPGGGRTLAGWEI